jgi:hypothetical protein
VRGDEKKVPDTILLTASNPGRSPGLTAPRLPIVAQPLAPGSAEARPPVGPARIGARYRIHGRTILLRRGKRRWHATQWE